MSAAPLTCIHCSGAMQPVSYMHDATESIWFYAFCTACGYQSESHEDREAHLAACAAIGSAK
jgi:hypothetical protein